MKSREANLTWEMDNSMYPPEVFALNSVPWEGRHE
jgi:hypothetical protein